MKWRRILIWSGIALAAILVYAWFFGISTMFAIEARWLGRSSPVVWKTPVALPDTSISKSVGTRVSYFGYQFEVPRDDFNEQKSRPVGKWQVLFLRSGRQIIFCTSPPKELINFFFDPSKIDRGKIERLLGPEDLESDYNFIHDMLETTPAKPHAQYPETANGS